MSLVFSVVYENSVQLLTDGAAVDDEGNLAAIYTKVVTSNKPLFAMACRGDTMVSGLMQTAALAMAEYCTLDEILVNIEDGLRHAADSIIENNAHVEIIVAGLSETRGLSHYIIASAQYAEWMPAFTMCQIPQQGWVSGGSDDIDAFKAEGLDPTLFTEAGESALSLFGGKLANAFRKMSGKHRTGLELDKRWSMSCIGGRADVTIVSREGVTVERVADWADEFGKPIDPTVPMEVAA